MKEIRCVTLWVFGRLILLCYMSLWFILFPLLKLFLNISWKEYWNNIYYLDLRFEDIIEMETLNDENESKSKKQ